MNRILAPLFVLALAATVLAACAKPQDAPPATASPDATSPLPPFPSDDAPDRSRDRRPPPASSGLNSDPSNPSGAPGGGTIGTGVIRY